MYLQARPNLNGNTPEDFEKRARAIFDAAHALTEAMSEAREITHGRNYQTNGDPAYNRGRDLNRFQQVLDAASDAKLLAAEMNAAARLHERA